MALNLTPEDIVPATTPEQTAAATPPASEPAEDTSATLPEDVLAIPAMHGLLHGAPPAIYSPNVRRNDPELAVIAKNAEPLVNAGFGFYKSKDKKYSVLFNTAYITEDQLKKADEAGKLIQVAAPFDQVRDTYAAAITGQPVAPGAPAAGPALPPPVVNAPLPASSQNKITTARLKNLSFGSPTSGPSPGAGRVLNNILKPTV